MDSGSGPRGHLESVHGPIANFTSVVRPGTTIPPRLRGIKIADNMECLSLTHDVQRDPGHQVEQEYGDFIEGHTGVVDGVELGVR